MEKAHKLRLTKFKKQITRYKNRSDTTVDIVCETTLHTITPKTYIVTVHACSICVHLKILL
jgi:hypothetical protein